MADQKLVQYIRNNLDEGFSKKDITHKLKEAWPADEIEAAFNEAEGKKRKKTEGKRAGFWIRLLAYLIDNFIYGIATGIFSAPIVFLAPQGDISAAGPGASGAFLVAILLSLALWVFNWGWLVAKKGATMGKLILDLKIVRPDGSYPTLWRALLLRHFIGYTISSFILGLGYLWIAFDKEKQGWHDKIADTRVVRKA